jgi:hypothetical protein
MSQIFKQQVRFKTIRTNAPKISIQQSPILTGELMNSSQGWARHSLFRNLFSSG